LGARSNPRHDDRRRSRPLSASSFHISGCVVTTGFVRRRFVIYEFRGRAHSRNSCEYKHQITSSDITDLSSAPCAYVILHPDRDVPGLCAHCVLAEWNTAGSPAADRCCCGKSCARLVRLPLGEAWRGGYGRASHSSEFLILEQNYKGHAQAREELDSLLRKMGAYFPFQATGMQREMQVNLTLCHRTRACANLSFQTEDAFQELNLIFCELASLLLLSPQAPVKSRKSASSQIAHVSAHIVRLLRGEPPTGGALGRPLSAQAYAALLPSIWALLAGGARTGHATGAGELLSAVLEHAVRGSSTSATKRLSVEFVGRLVLVSIFTWLRGTLACTENTNSWTRPHSIVERSVFHRPSTARTTVWLGLCRSGCSICPKLSGSWAHATRLPARSVPSLPHACPASY
jgi:hypothetical protein